MIRWTLLLLLLPGLVWAELPNQLVMMRVKIQREKKAFVAKNIKLEEGESRDFWPLYHRYQEKLMKVNNRWGQIVFNIGVQGGLLSDKKAGRYLSDTLLWEEEKLNLKIKYLNKFKKILSNKTLARYYQLENKMEAIVAYDVALTLPLVK